MLFQEGNQSVFAKIYNMFTNLWIILKIVFNITHPPPTKTVLFKLQWITYRSIAFCDDNLSLFFIDIITILGYISNIDIVAVYVKVFDIY